MLFFLLLASILIAGSVLCLIYSGRKIWSLRNRVINVSFGFTVAIALVIGIYYGVFGNFTLNDHIRVQGLPIPLVTFVFENQSWVDYVTLGWAGYAFLTANALFPAGLTGGFWWLLATYLSSRRKRASS